MTRPSIVTVTAAATSYDLTTLARVKAELSITDDDSNALLRTRITEASGIVADHCNRVFASEAVSERFWPTDVETLQLARWPVSAVASVTVDGVALTTDDWLLDADTGQLHRLWNGISVGWGFGAIFYAVQSIVVVYTGGYVLPTATSGRNLPQAVENATVALVKARWFAGGRDPALKSLEVPGVVVEQYWVGATGDSLPAEVEGPLEAHRVPAVGV